MWPLHTNRVDEGKGVKARPTHREMWLLQCWRQRACTERRRSFARSVLSCQLLRKVRLVLLPEKCLVYTHGACSTTHKPVPALLCGKGKRHHLRRRRRPTLAWPPHRCLKIGQRQCLEQHGPSNLHRCRHSLCGSKCCSCVALAWLDVKFSCWAACNVPCTQAHMLGRRVHIDMHAPAWRAVRLPGRGSGGVWDGKAPAPMVVPPVCTSPWFDTKIGLTQDTIQHSEKEQVESLALAGACCIFWRDFVFFLWGISPVSNTQNPSTFQ